MLLARTRTLIHVVRQPRYAVLASGVGAVVFVTVALFPHSLLLRQFLRVEGGISEIIAFTANLLNPTQGMFTWWSLASAVAIALLLGLNVACLLFYILRSRTSVRPVTTAWWQMGGVVAGILGMGCAACGVAVLASILQLVGAVWVISLLPLHGQEFSIVAIALLGYSLWRLLTRIANPMLCSL